MNETLVPGQNILIPTAMFNHETVINDSSYSLNITAMHDEIGRPILIIRDAVKTENAERDNAIQERLKKLEGVEVGN